MAKDLNDRQKRLHEYLLTRYEDNEPLPLKPQICRELGCAKSELHSDVTALKRWGYIEEAPDVSDRLQYRVLLDREGNPLPHARPRYLQRARSGHLGAARASSVHDPGRLTPMERRVLRLIHTFFAENAYPPTVADLDARSLTAGVTQLHNYVVSLEGKHWIERVRGGARAIKLNDCAFELLGPISFGTSAATNDGSQAQVFVRGEIAAGQGRYVGDQTPQEELHVPIRLIRKYDRTGLFAVRVIGRSMVDRGLQPGDYLVVHAQAHAESGELVTALVDEGDPGAIVKTYRKRDGRTWLEPANAAMGFEPISVDHADLQGKVIALLRFYEDQPIGSNVG